MSSFWARAAIALGVVSGLCAGSAAADCGCTLFPRAGVYQSGDGPMSLSYAEDAEFSCPTAIRLRAERRDAPNADVLLACENDVWTGIEAAPELDAIGRTFGLPAGSVVFEHRLAAISEQPAPAGRFAPEIAAGLEASGRISYTLTPPAVMGPPRSAELTVSIAGGRAPRCLCERLAYDIAFSERMLAAYDSEALLAQVDALNIRGLSQEARYGLEEDGRAVRFGSSGSSSALQAIVSRIANDALDPGAVAIETNGAIRTGRDAAGDAVTAGPAARASTEGELAESSAAQTDPRNCRVTLPRPAEICAAGDSRAYVEAAIAHEEVHARTCAELNRMEGYVMPDGREMRFVDGGAENHGVRGKGALEGEGAVKGDIGWRDGSNVGFRLPVWPYLAWSQIPRNHALDEAGAYRVELGALRAAYAAQCP